MFLVFFILKNNSMYIQISFIRILVQFISYDVLIVLGILLILILFKNFNLFITFFYQNYFVLFFMNFNFFLI